MYLVTLLISLLLAGPAFGWNEPSDFRGIPWGTSIEEAKRTVPTMTCVPLSGACREFFNLGPVRVYAFSTFRNGGFDQTDLTFLAHQFGDLKAIFIERYGEPTSSRSEQMHDSAPVRNEILEWTGDRVYVELRRYGRDLDRGTAVLRTRAGLEEERKRRGDAAKEDKSVPAKDGKKHE